MSKQIVDGQFNMILYTYTILIDTYNIFYKYVPVALHQLNFPQVLSQLFLSSWTRFCPECVPKTGHYQIGKACYMVVPENDMGRLTEW